MNEYDPNDPYWIKVDAGICANCGSKSIRELAIVIQCLDCEGIQMPPLNSIALEAFLNDYLADKKDKK